MRRGLLDGLRVVIGGIFGFALTFAGFILWIRLSEARHPVPVGEGRVYGVILPSLIGSLLGALVAMLLVLRDRRCRS
jgi:hypothetical protein